MIQVDNLSKRFGKNLAVDNISFEVQKGEILGLLGPNGAGKTTTMRMLTCYLPPTSGTAHINGLDIFDDSLKVRRLIGYLPESVPLYTDMRVREYLLFRARLQGVSRDASRSRLDYVLEKCHLREAQNRIIGQLSKGYRQRVGLAGAIIHDPPVLILDEPTIGLDPNQIRETRTLIKDLGRERTIVLSTHILPEVEAVCQRVIILDKGRILAMDTPEGLMSSLEGATQIQAEVRGPADKILAGLRALEGVLDVQPEAKNGVTVFRIQTRAGQDMRERVSQSIVQSAGIIREFKTARMGLEDIFVKITTSEMEAPIDREEGVLESNQTAAVS